MSEPVSLTVTELMAAYRDSLLALVPVMDRCPTVTEAPFVFIDFGTDREPFDQVKARRVSPEGIPGDRVVSLPARAVTFRLAWRQAGGVRRRLHQLRLPV